MPGRGVLVVAGLAVLAAAPARAAAPAITWQRSLKEAGARAKESKRPLLILFTSEHLHKTTRRCRFAGARVRQGVAEAGLLCVRILKPQMPTAAAVRLGGNANIGPALQIARKEYGKRLEAYNKNARRYGVTNLPCVVLAYPDGEVFRKLHAPRDSEIIGALRVLVRTPLAAVERPREETPPLPEEIPARLDPAEPARKEPALPDAEQLEVAARVDPFEAGLDPEDF